MFEDTKGVTSRKQKDRQYNVIIKSRTQKERQCNGQRYKENNDLQNTAPDIKDRATRTTLKLGMNSGASAGLVDRAPLVTPIVLPLNNRFWLVIITSYLTTVL